MLLWSEFTMFWRLSVPLSLGTGVMGGSTVCCVYTHW